MPDPSLAEILDALADQLRYTLSSAIDGLQVEGRLVFNPTPICLDIYPADPFMEQTAMGAGSREVFLTVRARVSTADHEGAQEWLLDMMDPRSTASVIAAVASDKTLSGKVQQAHVSEGPSEFRAYSDAGGQGELLGCQWTVRVVL